MKLFLGCPRVDITGVLWFKRLALTSFDRVMILSLVCELKFQRKEIKVKKKEKTEYLKKKKPGQRPVPIRVDFLKDPLLTCIGFLGQCSNNSILFQD